MDLDDFDDFDDMARIPAKPDRPSRPNSQMFEEPLHIEGDGTGGFDSGFDNDFGDAGGMSTSSLPPLDSVPADIGDNFSVSGLGGQAPPVSSQAPVFVTSDGGGIGLGGSGGTCTTVVACCLFCILLLGVVGLLVLSVIILLVCLDISDDVNNLKFKVTVPTNPPAAPLPSQIIQ
mmetsp:Transcript_34181/g.47734  ORF Transcript_34181/g.47734 Transcript_34181/m.47734 type:complete len:175 (-) Transcript_34181:162-686(-)